MTKYPLDIFMVIGGMPFDGHTIKHSSLGGSETAALCVARELAAMGHRIVVFSNLPAEAGEFDGVFYNYLDQASESVQKIPHDVLIVQRNPQVFGLKMASKLNFLWNHDLATREMGPLHSSALWNVDGIFLLSDFHIEQYKKEYPFIHHKQYIKTRNGIDLDLFPADVAKVPKKIMYCARPERGLINLLREGGIMDELYKLDPEIHLYLAGYYNPVEHLAEMYNYFKERAELMPNVTDLGCLPKHELYRHYAEAELYAYPTPHPGTPFAEISCITAMECMASGCVFVSTTKGALPETLGQGTAILFDLGTDHPHFQQQFVQTVHNLLNDGRADLERMAKAGKKRAKNFTWKGVAKQWDKTFQKMFRRATKDQDKLIDHFLYHEDVVTALRLAEKHRKTATISEINQKWGWTMRPDSHAATYEIFARDEFKDRAEDHVAHHYDRVFQGETRWQATQDWLEMAELKPPAQILDVGCGCGYFSVGLANLGYHVTGFDIAPEYIKQARQLGKLRGNEKAEWEFFLESDPPWKTDLDGSDPAQYDLIYIAEVLEHLAYIEPQDYVKQFEPYLKDDGWFLITTPFGPLKRVAPRGSGQHHELHVRHIEKQDIEELFGHKEHFNAHVHFWQHTEHSNDLCGWYLYAFRKGGDYGQIDWHRKVTVQNPRNRLSVCMIAKNEEANLRRCLESVKEAADEIILGDTGSNDRTNDIALEYGATIVQAPNPLHPDNGFEAARNASIKPAKGEWILWIDADEELQGYRELMKYLRTFSAYDAFRIRQHHFTCQPAGGYKIDRPCRVFRNGKGIRFFGIIHEHPETKINDGPGSTIELSDVDIAHTGYYTEPKRRKKFWRNLPLLERDRQIYPERVLGKFLYMRDLIHLAQWEMDRNGGQPSGKAASFCQEAVQIYQNWFLSMGGFMMHDGLEYYSAALRLLGIGQVYTYMLKVDDNQPAQRQAIFYNREDFMVYMEKTAAEQGGR